MVPGYDREVGKSGDVKRVYEAVYVKSLVPDQAFSMPSVKNLTPKTLAPFEFLFPAKMTKETMDPEATGGT